MCGCRMQSPVAGKTEDAERKLEISKLAGQVLSPHEL